MDPVTSIVTSITQLTGTIAKMIKYINDMQNAPKDRTKLAQEATNLLWLLTDLRSKVEEAESADSWLKGACSLGGEWGLLKQFNEVIEELASKLNPQGVARINRLCWPLDKNEINDILSKIERIKSLVSLALQKDHLKQNNLLAKRQEGTREWVLKADSFKNWFNGTEKILWCPGLPGAGKTILTSIVVNFLEQSLEQENIGIAYIYCSYKDRESQTASNLIASLLQQLMKRRRNIPNAISSLYQESLRTRQRPTLDVWSKLLQSEVHHASRVFILVDALDECPESGGVRWSFLNEIQKLQPNIHLLVTSRHSLTIEREFDTAIQLEINANDEDVRSYLWSQIEMKSRLVLYVAADPILKAKILDTITMKAKGMQQDHMLFADIFKRFLLAELHINSLAGKTSRRDIHRHLEKLLEELNDTYKEALQRIWDQHRDDAKLARRVLYWISYASRSLTVTEVQHALAVDPRDTDLDGDAIPDKNILVSVCAGLVVIDLESNIIRLVHDTAREYLERIRISEFPEAQSNIARTCLTYLSFGTFAKGYCTSDKDLELRLRQYPFLEYVAQHWGKYLQRTSDKDLEILACDFLKHNSKLISSIQVIHLPKKYRYSGYSQFFPKDITGLHIAASLGLPEIVSRLLKDGFEITVKDLDGRTALHWAAESGHEQMVQVVRVLLENGADIMAKDKCGRAALHWAAWSGQEAVIRLLLDMGADFAAKDSYDGTVLYRAVESGRREVVQLLLDKGANVTARGRHGWTALHRAAAFGHVSMVRPLLEKGADVRATDVGGVTPLHRAAEGGHEEVVRLLLEGGADLAAKVSYGWTALHRSAWEGNEIVVELLLEEGADITAKDSYGGTALHRAAEGGREGVVQLLLRRGTNVNFKDSGGATPLHRAAYHGHENVARLLLREGADFEEEDSDGRTALDKAVECGHGELARLLFRQGANIASTKDWYGGTTLSTEARDGREAVMRLLLKQDFNVLTMKDAYGETALHRAAEHGHEAVVRLLLKKGANAQERDSLYGLTALQWARRGGHQAVVHLLTSLTPRS